jgi:hypothetical protein
MNRFFFALLIGCVVAAIDSLPMFFQRMPRMSIISACVQCVVVALVIFHVSAPLPDALLGALVSLLCALPIVLVIAANEPKSIIPVLAMQAGLGLLDGLALAFLKSRNLV